MSADYLGPGGILRRIRCVAGTVTRRIAGLSAAAVVMAGASVSAQLPIPSLDPAGGQPGTFSSVNDRDEYTGKVDAIHSPNVDRIMKAQYKLDVARRHSQLMTFRRNVRRVAVVDSDVADIVQFSPTEVSIIGLQLGSTNLNLWFEGEADPSIFEVTVVRDENIEEQRRVDFGRLERKLAMMFPNSNVYLTPVGIQVHVRGQAYDAEEADQILQIVRTEVIRSYGRYSDVFDQTGFRGNGAGLGGGGGLGGGQNGFNNQNNGIGGGLNDIIVNDLTVPGAFNVALRVVIAEINRDQARDAAVDLTAVLRNGQHTLSSALGGATNQTLGGVYNNGEITAAIRWLATNGTISLLAEPTLVTMSGHPASLLGGGEFAVPTIIGLGGGQNTSFRGVGTSMVVTPTILDRDQVRLQVQAEHSAINNGQAVNGIPGTDAKRVQTTVQLREGQTLAIGGLISRQTTTSVSRIPLLGSIPFVGTRLFHSKSSQEGDTELLILVTPEIVHPMEPDEVPPLPNFYHTHPNDDDLWKYARTEGNPDQNVYQVQPYGSGATFGVPQGYHLFNPPANGPGFQPGPSGTGYHSQGMQPQLMPQPEQNLPPAHPMPYQQMPAGTPYQQVPAGTVVPQHAPMTAPQMVPPAAAPTSPLPPIPGQQHSLNLQPAPKPGFAERFNALFRSKPDAQQPGVPRTPVSTVGWRR